MPACHIAIIMRFLIFNPNRKENKMKDFLEKYKAVKIETSQDEGKLTLETAKKRILKLLVINIKNTKDDSWDLANRMNKLMIDTDSNSNTFRCDLAVSELFVILWSYWIKNKR